MRFTLLTVAALSALVSAQSISDLPACAQTCVNGGIQNSGCSNLVNISCICSSTAFINQLSCCVANACNAADQATTVGFAQKLCATVGVTNLPTSASCSNTTSNATSSSTTTSSRTSSTGTTAATASTAAGVLAQQFGFGAVAAGVIAAFL